MLLGFVGNNSPGCWERKQTNEEESKMRETVNFTI